MRLKDGGGKWNSPHWERQRLVDDAELQRSFAVQTLVSHLLCRPGSYHTLNPIEAVVR